MADSPIGDAPPPVPEPAPVPDPASAFKSYGIRLGYWFMGVIAAALALLLAAWMAQQFGVNLQIGPPPAPPVVTAKVEEPAPILAQEAPPPDVLHFCGYHLSLIEKLQAKPWPNRTIKWSIDTSEYIGTMDRARIVEAFDVAWKAWANGLDINPMYVESETQADVRSRFGTVFRDDGTPDTAGSILAWSELSDGSGRPCRQMYDKKEPWTISTVPGQGVIDLVRVACHEIGHALGLGHTPVPTGLQLMDPTYNRSVQFPTDGDYVRAIALGYPPRTRGSDPAPAIELKVFAKEAELIDLLRRRGWKVEKR